MSYILTRGLGTNAGEVLLQGYGPGLQVSILPGSYRLTKNNLLYSILGRGLEVRRLAWRSEEVNPMVVVVKVRNTEYNLPIPVAHTNQANIEAKVPIASLNTQKFSSLIELANSLQENNKIPIPIVLSKKEEKHLVANIYHDLDYMIRNPSVVFSKGDLKVIYIGAPIMEKKSLEFVRR
jgi:hypothetical protein